MSYVLCTDEALYTSMLNSELRSKVIDRVENIKKQLESDQEIKPLNLLRIKILMQTKDNDWYELVETTILYDQNKPIRNAIGNINERCLDWINSKLSTYKYIINSQKMIHVYNSKTDIQKLVSTEDVKEINVYFLA